MFFGRCVAGRHGWEDRLCERSGGRAASSKEVPRPTGSAAPTPVTPTGSGPLVFESSPLAAAHGTPSELVLVRTLTGGPEVQEEALAALDRFRAAIDLAADAIVLIDYDTHRYLDVNATACRMFGYSREEMLSLGPQRVKFRDCARTNGAKRSRACWNCRGNTR